MSSPVISLAHLAIPCAFFTPLGSPSIVSAILWKKPRSFCLPVAWVIGMVISFSIALSAKAILSGSTTDWATGCLPKALKPLLLFGPIIALPIGRNSLPIPSPPIARAPSVAISFTISPPVCNWYFSGCIHSLIPVPKAPPAPAAAIAGINPKPPVIAPPAIAPATGNAPLCISPKKSDFVILSASMATGLPFHLSPIPSTSIPFLVVIA